MSKVQLRIPGLTRLIIIPKRLVASYTPVWCFDSPTHWDTNT